MKKIIHNVETGEITEVDLTPEEEAQVKLDIQQSEKFAKEQLDEYNKAKTKRDALLAKLGITEEEAKLLLG